MDITVFLIRINQLLAYSNSLIALPATIIFFGASVFLTYRLRFPQFRGFPYFVRLLTQSFVRKKEKGPEGETETISSFHALFTAMASTIGMGNIVGPSIAIMAGGPGALFWMLVYIFFGSVTKFTEVTFAMKTRIKTTDGTLIGGPMEYLKLVHSYVAYWYVLVMIFLFMGWSSLQSNTLASILDQESISALYVGAFLAILVLIVLSGGVKRVGNIASMLVPLMFALYFMFAAGILLNDVSALWWAIKLVISQAFKPASAFGGFIGATLFQAMQAGIYRGIFITEAGLGTSSIPHAVSDAKYPVDQGLLALFSMISDAFLSTLSGLLVLVTGVWTSGVFRSTLIYEAFKLNSPLYGKYVLILSVGLFVLTTIIGNSFNGKQSFASLTNNRWVSWYIGATCTAIFLGALVPVQLMWNIMDLMLALVAVPNVIGLIALTIKYPEILKISRRT